ncbi:unnamed protein product [Arctogadus glacialis]
MEDVELERSSFIDGPLGCSVGGGGLAVAGTLASTPSNGSRWMEGAFAGGSLGFGSGLVGVPGGPCCYIMAQGVLQLISCCATLARMHSNQGLHKTLALLREITLK